MVLPSDPNTLIQFNDVDIVVQGTDHYEACVELARINHNGAMKGKKSRAKYPHHHAARERRRQLSKLMLHDKFGPFYSDFKVVARPDEQILDISCLGSLKGQVEFSGTVTEANQSLGLPAVWKISGLDKPVVSTMYDAIGAAGVRDDVVVSGVSTSSGHVLLFDSKTSYIYCPSLYPEE